jgi:type III pantothenate kinase
MTLLVVDIGNSRIKWATYRNKKLSAQRAADYTTWDTEEFARRVLPSKNATLERVIVCSVARSKINTAFTKAVLKHCGFQPDFYKVQRSAAGMTTRYREPWRLGVDRFVAAIGAWHLTRNQAVCVADIGTATTLDFVSASGVHHGGVIIPGPELMLATLLRHTDGIRHRASGRNTGAGRSILARQTRAAIELGAYHANAALITHFVQEVSRSHAAPIKLLLTGGEAARVSRYLKVRHQLIPDLVLRGLVKLSYDPD